MFLYLSWDNGPRCLRCIATLLALLCTEAPRKEVQKNNKTYYVAIGDRALPQGSPASPGLTNIACLRLDRRLSGLANKFGWRYTRYADDLTFSFPKGKGQHNAEQMKKYISSIVVSEGFEVHEEKTTVMGMGSRQEVTGLVVNGQGDPRPPREVIRMLRAAIHNLQNGHSFKEGENLQTLLGYAGFIYASDPDKGEAFIEQLANLPEGVGLPKSQQDGTDT